MNRRRVTVATGVVTAAAVVAVLPVVAASPVTAQAASGCSILEVTGADSGGTHLVQRMLPSDQATALRTLRSPVNAIGAAASAIYGVGEHGHVVSMDRSGHQTDLGLPKGHDSHALAGATAGTVVGDRWYVRSGRTLYQVDVDPGSNAYLRITGAVRLHPAALAENLDDVDAAPGGGPLYGVAEPNRWHGIVVRVDPLSGRVTPVRGDLPGGSSYGAVSFGRDGALYARQNDILGRSVRYRIPLQSGHVTVLDTSRAVGSSDATGCLPAAPPPPTTTTPRPTTTTPRPPTTTVPPPTTTVRPTTSPPPTTTVVPLAVVLPHTTVPPTTATPPPSTRVVPPPPPVVATPDEPLPTSTAIPLANVRERTQQRRWGLTALILIIGGAAAGSRMRPSRRTNR